MVELTLEIKKFLTQMAVAKKALQAFAAQATTVRLGLDTTQMQDKLAAAKMELLALAKDAKSMRLGVDATKVWTEIAAIKTTLDSLNNFDINIDANTALAMAKIEALKGQLASLKTGALLTPSIGGINLGLGSWGGGSSGGTSDTGGALSMGAALMNLLTGGGGKGIGGFGAGLPAFGSLLSLGGFGAEHILGTGVGIAGSMAGAGLGGLLMGGASMGVMGVGMGTDMAGMGQALGDIRAIHTAQVQVNQAMQAYHNVVAQYGAGSAQATVALQNLHQAQVAYTGSLQELNPVVRTAIANAASAATAFGTLFNQVTGPAEKTGANIIQQLVQTAAKFLPTIGKFAAENMKIIQSALQPLMSWLSGPGLKIFTEVEQVFQNHLPTAMHAFVQVVELVLRTLGLLAPLTGHIIGVINKFATDMNGAGWGTWTHYVMVLVNLFHDWMGVIKQVALIIINVIKPVAGVGAAVAQILTAMLTQVNSWLKTVNGKGGTMSGFFGLHKAEIQQIGQILVSVLPIVEGFASAFMHAAIAIMSVVVPALKAVVFVVGEIMKIPFISQLVGWGAVLYLVGNKTIPLIKSLGEIATKAVSMATNVGGALIRLPGQIASVASSAANMASTWAQAVGRMVASAAQLVARVALVVARNVAGAAASAAAWVSSAAQTVASWVASAAKMVVSIALTVARNVAGAAASAAAWVASAASTVAGWVSSLAQLIARVAVTVATNVAGAATTAAAWVAAGATTVAGWIATVVQMVARVAVIVATNVAGAAASAAAWIAANAVMTAGIVLLVAAVVAAVYEIIKHWNGIAHFFSSLWHTVEAATVQIWDAIVNFFSQLPAKMLNIGRQIVMGLVHGIESAAGAVASAVKKVAGGVLGVFHKVLGIFSPSRETQLMGTQLMQGLSMGMQTEAQGGAPLQVVTTVLTALRGAVLKYLPIFRTLGTQLIVSFSLGMKSGSPPSLQVISTLMGQIRNLIQSFIPIFQSLGVQLMQGLAAGITSGAAAVAAASAAAANQAVAAAKSATGTASPSKVFAQVAQFWMDGLALGIRSNMGVAQGAMEQAVTGMIPHGALPGMGGMGAMGGGTITISAPITVTVAGTASTPHAIGGAVQQAVRQELTQVVRRLRAGAF